mgnify:CR=1 FL=1
MPTAHFVKEDFVIFVFVVVVIIAVHFVILERLFKIRYKYIKISSCFSISIRCPNNFFAIF